MHADLDHLAVLNADDRISRHFAALVEAYAAFYGMSVEVARAELLERLNRTEPAVAVIGLPAIGRALAQADAGEGRPWREVFSELEELEP